MKNPFFIIAILIYSVNISAQVNFTANDSIGPYQHPFCYGVNMGYYPGWTDKNLADLAGGNPDVSVDGVGVNGMRPALFSHFLEQYGYDIRIPEFEHYESLGIDQNVIFVGYPSEEQKSKERFCPTRQTEVFADMYTPIWDNGENGTPVNDDNDYALYLYKMVKRYKDYTKIWEIWNEPDFDYSSNAWRQPDYDKSWWNKDPSPCDYALYAPVQYYVRMLRISWEVIKTLDPDALIAVGGLGYPSFLDVIMRNTDNPDGGKVTEEYPLNAGAYFDVLSYHSYPHIDGSLREWSNFISGFNNYRNSDRAVWGMLDQQNEFRKVLNKWGYDGKKYPKKHWIITECNVPRKAFGDFMGSEEGQINFLIKAVVACQQNEIYQFHVYNLGETEWYDDATSEYHLMGLYQKLIDVKPYQQKVNNAGIAYKSASDLLSPFSYNAVATESLELPEEVGGGVFTSKSGKHRLVLWAKTTKDRSEEAFYQYTFPEDWKVKYMNIFHWDFSKTGKIKQIDGNKLSLGGAPLFIDPY